MTENPKPHRDPKGRFLKNTPPANPTGTGGFTDHPEHRNNGRWDHHASYTYNLNRYKNMTNSELAQEIQNIDNLTQAEQTALRLIIASKKENELAFRKYQDIADRTEGRAPQTINQNITQTEPPQITITFK